MGITCEIVWRQSSEYLDGTLDESSRHAMEQHIQGCQQCAAVIDGLRNIVALYGDERMGWAIVTDGPLAKLARHANPAYSSRNAGSGLSKRKALSSRVLPVHPEPADD